MDDRFSYEPPELESYIGSGIAFGTEGDSGPYNPGGDGDDGGGGQNGSAGCRSPRNRFLRP